jgi:meso-butanediol dehydrogenase/(S,S)-butanediol dehydrogenase/diacetyl reductase
MRFKDKTVIITGGDKGIGRAVAVGFAEGGANLVLGYFRDEKAAKKTAVEIRESGRKVETLQMDVRLKQDCEKLVAVAVERFGKLDIAVNNAGVSTMNWAVDLTEEEWDFNMDVNAKGVFFCCQAQVKQFIRQGGGGKIVNVASVAAKRGVPLLAHYAAAKFAVLGFAKSLAAEVAKHKICVNNVCPGLVKTSMQEREIGWEAKLRGISEKDVIRDYLNSVPLGRLEEPEDVARVVLFLASAESDYMTGQAINVAGGMLMEL